MNLADGQLVREMESGEEILSLRGRSRIQVISKKDEEPQKRKSKLHIMIKILTKLIIH